MYNKRHQAIVDEINLLMSWFSHTKKDLGYGQRRTFTSNALWFDVIDYWITGEVILRVWRGAWLVKTYPQLHSYFDVVSKVIAKVAIPDVEFLHERHIVKLFELLDTSPKNVPAIPV